VNNDKWLSICGARLESGAWRIGHGCHLIGRAEECNIRLWHESVSRQHATLVNDGGKLLIRDLVSRNGTFVDGKWVRSAKIRVGTLLRLGEVMLELSDHAPEVQGPDGGAEDVETPVARVLEPADAAFRVAHFPPRRKRVLELLLEGDCEKQLAVKLHGRERTVHWHVEQNYKDLGVHSRSQLVAQFRRADGNGEM